MVDLAHVNGIGNLCAQVGVLSANSTRVGFVGSAEHTKVQTTESLKKRKPKARNKFLATASWVNAITLDSLKLQKSVSLLHLDVEGHEGEVLEGARETIESSRPVIVTEVSQCRGRCLSLCAFPTSLNLNVSYRTV